MSAEGPPAYWTKPTALGRTGTRDWPPGYEVKGERYCIVTKTLAPGEQFAAERGALNFMSPGVKMDAALNLGGMVGGENVFKIMFTNMTSEPAYLGLSTNAPMAGVIPIHMRDYNGRLIAAQGAWMASTPDVTVTAGLVPARSLTACCCGGLPPIVQQINGAGEDSVALLSGGGTVIKKKLAAGEEMLVETGSLLAFSESVKFDVRQTGSFAVCCCGGEGLFNTVLTGPGDVFVQTSSYPKMIRLFMASSQ